MKYPYTISKHLFLLLFCCSLFFQCGSNLRTPFKAEVGDQVDELNGVAVYYNGRVGNIEGRNTKDGYNIGLRYQCVEFVKRYYFEYFDHRMPDSYGHALSFYHREVADGGTNHQRALTQYSNPSNWKPQVSDLLVMDKTAFNSFGHVAIISAVHENEIEIIQQNPGPFSPSRVSYPLIQTPKGQWKIEYQTILGWLRKE